MTKVEPGVSIDFDGSGFTWAGSPRQAAIKKMAFARLAGRTPR